MNEQDIKELKKRISPNTGTMTRMCGCIINADKEIEITFNDNFLNIDDACIYKYADKARAVFSTKLDDNMMELKYHGNKIWESVYKSGLKDNKLMLEVYKAIRTHLPSGSFLVLFFHDRYDIIRYTKNMEKLDESEETYEYIIGCICPVTRSAPALAYDDENKRMGISAREWIVGVPCTGWVYPSFDRHSADTEHMMFYSRKADDVNHELIRQCLMCDDRLTTTETMKKFEAVVFKGSGSVGESERYLTAINSVLMYQPVDELLKTEDLRAVCLVAHIPLKVLNEICIEYEKAFPEFPVARNVINKKRLPKVEKHDKAELYINLLKAAAEKLKNEDHELVAKINDAIKMEK